MRTVRLMPDTLDRQLRELAEDLRRTNAPMTVTVSEDDEQLSPQQVASRLGFSRQHVRRLIDSGELAAEQMGGSRYWKIPALSVWEFEQRREEARRHADEFSRSLDELGAPPE